jgi:hypothetical protein
MEHIKDKQLETKRSVQEAIEIRVWQIYLSRNRQNLYEILAAYSLDHGPVEKNATERDRVSLRFLVYDWEKTIQHLFVRNNIPYIVHQRFSLNVVDYMMKRAPIQVLDALRSVSLHYLVVGENVPEVL